MSCGPSKNTTQLPFSTTSELWSRYHALSGQYKGSLVYGQNEQGQEYYAVTITAHDFEIEYFREAFSSLEEAVKDINERCKGWQLLDLALKN